jgi:hypothetical protein
MHTGHTHTPVVLHACILDVFYRAAHLAELVALAGDVLPTDVHVYTGLHADAGLQHSTATGWVEGVWWWAAEDWLCMCGSSGGGKGLQCVSLEHLVVWR